MSRLVCAESFVLSLLASMAACNGDGDSMNNNENGNDVLPICGNAVVEEFEECDEGSANSDQRSDACRTNCVKSWCGDGVVDTGELCDEGPANSDRPGAACRKRCGLPSCGDGILDPGEQCDAGSANSSCEPNVCRPSCSIPHCGDGVTDSPYDGACGGAGQCVDCESQCTDCDGDRYGVGGGCVGPDCDDADPLVHEGCGQPCNATTCPDGCCAEGVCVTEQHQGIDHCGAGGAACEACFLTQACDAGNCTGPACGDGEVETGETCDDGSALNGVYGYCNYTCTGDAEPARVFYSKAPSGPGDLFSALLDGSDETLMTTGVLVGSVGGGKICFGKDGSVVVINTDGTGETVVPDTTDLAPNSEVDCSPDGSRVIYAAGTNNFTLVMIDINGSNKMIFYDGAGASMHQLSPSWNVMDYIVFGITPYGNSLGQRLYRLDVSSAGGSPTQLTTSFSQMAESGGFAGRIAYNDQPCNLYIMNSDGSGQTQLTAAETCTVQQNNKAWIRGTNRLVYMKAGNLWMVDADNTTNVQLTASGDIARFFGVE